MVSHAFCHMSMQLALPKRGPHFKRKSLTLPGGGHEIPFDANYKSNNNNIKKQLGLGMQKGVYTNTYNSMLKKK